MLCIDRSKVYVVVLLSAKNYVKETKPRPGGIFQSTYLLSPEEYSLQFFCLSPSHSHSCRCYIINVFILMEEDVELKCISMIND